VDREPKLAADENEGDGVIFVGIDPAIGGFGLGFAVILGFTLACAGVVVGAIYGLALARLLRWVRLGAGDGQGDEQLRR